ncbi:hypothetical protein TNCV_3089961, partial [Trichonephila clavipes]
RPWNTCSSKPRREASQVNKTYANTTEEDVEVDGQASFTGRSQLLEMGDADKK